MKIGASFLVLAMHVHPQSPHAIEKIFASTEAHSFLLPNKGGKRSADRRRTRELHPLPGTAEILVTRIPRLSAPHYGLTAVTPSRPGPALPGITGSTDVLHILSGASAVGTLQSEHVPDGHDAQAACAKE